VKFQKTHHAAEKPVRAKGLQAIVDVMKTPRNPRRNPGGRPRKARVPDVAPENLDPLFVLKLIAGNSSVPPAVRAAACRTLLAFRTDVDAAELQPSADALTSRALQILQRRPN
jgi:hypothetical protein